MYLLHAVPDAVRENSDRLVSDRGEERVKVGEVSVCGVGDNTDRARYLTQDDCVRPARPREIQAGVNKRCSDSAGRARPSTWRRIARLRATCCFPIVCWHSEIVVDTVH